MKQEIKIAEANLFNNLDSANDKIAEAYQAKKYALEEFVKVSGVKKGDIVIANHYSHSGKQIKINSIFAKERFSGVELIARGFVYKEDGTIGKNIANHVIVFKKEA